MDKFEQPNPEIVCPKCGKKGVIGDDFFSYKPLSNTEESLSINFNCPDCEKPIVVEKGKVAVSPDSLFKILGIIGEDGKIVQLLEQAVCSKITITSSDGSKKDLVHDSIPANGMIQISIPGKEKLTIPIGKPQLLMSDGIYQKHLLPEPVDKAVFISLEPTDISNEEKEKIKLFYILKPEKDNLYHSILIAATKNSSKILVGKQINVICKLFTITDTSIYAKWFLEIINAIDSANQEKYNESLLCYARSCELFVKDYLFHIFKLINISDEEKIKSFIKNNKRGQISFLVDKLLKNLVIDYDMIADAKTSWADNVKDIRNAKIGHENYPVTAKECNLAHDSAYWFIRSIQRQCLIEQGRKWNYWTKLLVKY